MGVLASAVIAALLQFLLAVASGSIVKIIRCSGNFRCRHDDSWYLAAQQASIEKWNDFMESQTKAVTATGSFLPHVCS